MAVIYFFPFKRRFPFGSPFFFLSFFLPSHLHTDTDKGFIFPFCFAAMDIYDRDLLAVERGSKRKEEEKEEGKCNQFLHSTIPRLK